jgi:hypothetical protein
MDDIQKAIKYFIDAQLHILYLNYLHYEAIIVQYLKLQLKYSHEKLTILSREAVLWIKDNVDTNAMLQFIHTHIGLLGRVITME